MKRLYLILSLLILFQFNQLFSQFTPGQLINEVNTLATRKAANSLSYSDIEGTPYYTNEFIKSTVYLKNGNYASAPLRYDLYRDEMEFKLDNQVFWLTKKDIKLIRYGNEMVFTAPSISDTSKLGYFFINDLGKNKLFCKKGVTFLPFIPPKGYAATVPNRFERNKDEFYIVLEGSRVQKIKNNRDLTTIFAGHKAALDFIKKERIKADRFEDLQKLVNYINN